MWNKMKEREETKIGESGAEDVKLNKGDEVVWGERKYDSLC
jgi:hypothetical protein